MHPAIPVHSLEEAVVLRDQRCWSAFRPARTTTVRAIIVARRPSWSVRPISILLIGMPPPLALWAGSVAVALASVAAVRVPWPAIALTLALALALALPLTIAIALGRGRITKARKALALALALALTLAIATIARVHCRVRKLGQ